MSHLYWLSIYGVFLGHTTIVHVALGDRELFIDLAESSDWCKNHIFLLGPGRRLERDLPRVFAEERSNGPIFRETSQRVREHFLQESTVHVSREGAVGVLSRQRAIELGTTGPTFEVGR